MRIKRNRKRKKKSKDATNNTSINSKITRTEIPPAVFTWKFQQQENAGWFPVPVWKFSFAQINQHFVLIKGFNIKFLETYSRVDGSVDPSSPSIRYTLPNMTYSNESARDGIPKSCGAHSPASEHPSSRKVVAKTKRNLSPTNKCY